MGENDSTLDVSIQPSIDTKENSYSCSRAKNGAKFDKRITKQLIEISEDVYDDEQLSNKVYVGGTQEKLDSWEYNTPNPKFVTAKRKKSLSVPSEPVNGDEMNKTDSDPYSQCYEIDFVECPAWRIGVEPLTYRYMSNHGRYRAYKLGQRLINVNSRLRSNGKVNYDRHKLRNAIQTELKMEFETFLHCEKLRRSMIRQQQLAELKNIMRRENKTNTESCVKDSKEMPAQELQEYPDKKDMPFSVIKEGNIDSDSTPRSNISFMSSQTPLPPITVPLVFSEDPSDLQRKASEEINSTMQSSREEPEKSQRLWHIPPQISVNKDSDILLRHRSAPKLLENSNHSESGSRVSSSRNGTTARGVKEGHLYRLKKLPTISDFHEHHQENNSSNAAKDSFVIRRMSQPVNNYNKVRSDDTASITSEPPPPLAATPVLQGTAYDVNKLRISTSEIFNTNPEIVTLLDDVRASQRAANSNEQAPLRYLAEKYKRNEQLESGDSLEDVITTKQYISSKSRTGLNPYLRKPRLQIASQPVSVDACLEQDFSDAFQTIPMSKKPVRNAMSGDVMPGMLVRRAEISMTSKRVI